MASLDLDLVVLLLKLGVQRRPNARELEVFCDVFIFKSLLYLFLEYHQLVLHLRVDVPFVVCGPEAPESIADDVAEARLLLFAEDVLPQLRQDVLPLLQLLPYFLLMPRLPLVLRGMCLFHCIRAIRNRHF